jgi:glycosyltransferase involved in cell wall biosynthesis
MALELRVLATSPDGSAGDGRFVLVRARTPAFYALLPFHIARELRTFRPHVVVAQSPYEAAAALAARRIAGVRARVLLEVHGDWGTATRVYGSRLRRLAEPVSRRVAAAAVRRADAIRTVSPYTSDLVRALGVEPTATFTAYLDSSAFTAHPVQPLPERPALLFVGVLERYKNIAVLAEAWRLAAPQLPDARLRIVGRGHERGVIESLVRDLPGQTSWTERLESHEVAAALDEATALVLPSVSEGLPRVAMEAFARGRPVVGARAGGIPDIVQDDVSGLLVPGGDPQALAGAMLRVLAERELAARLAVGAAASASQWLETPDEFAGRMRRLVDDMRR